MKNQSRKYFARLRKFSLLYSLNQFKFNKFRLLSKLTYLLNNIIGKKIQYNIINLKSITYHPDLFTNILALKIQKERINPSRRIKSLLHKTRLVTNNKIKERTRTPATDKLDNFRDSYRDLKVISHMDTSSYASSKNLSSLLENILGKMYNDQNLVTKYKNDGNHSKQIHNLIFNSIGYKNLGGIKLQVSGRLTKRYRADRAIQFLK
jgi:hypothetical protein